MLTYKGFIEKLGAKEIFVFGSNLRGFHGAGSAGFASFGVPGNRWREFGYGRKPNGWRGLWNVKGCAEGLQHGTDGWSYALPTVTRPGVKRSRTADEIIASIEQLYITARANPTWRFLMAFGIGGGHNGYSPDELAKMFAARPIPKNIIFENKFAKLVEKEKRRKVNEYE